MSRSFSDTLRCALRASGALTAIGLLAVALTLPAPMASAQQGPPPMPGDMGQQPGDGGGDPPARVGRLSFTQGTVSFHTLDADQWEQADPNYPVTEGLSFWTEPGSRAALQLGNGVVRLDGGTEVDVQQFNDQAVQINVPQGAVNFRLRRLDPNESYQISTPSGTVALTAPGSYHVDAGVNGAQGSLTIFQGSAQPVGDNFNMAMTSGPQAQPTDIDQWSDQQESQVAQTPNYVSPEMPGAADLGGQGNWNQTPDYGPVWYPPVEAGWAPYRYGHWAFVPPWGWTWVDDASWGFAPFHYGRWVQIGPRWAWVPGQVVQRPVYAPALVAFVGGGGLSIGIGVGGGGPAVGWVPLGPREVYVPPYGGSIEYVRRVNRTNVVNVNNITITTIRQERRPTTFINAGAVTVVHSDAMTRSASISKAAVKVQPTALGNATVTSQAPVKPTLATVGAGPTVVKAMGGNVTQDEKRKGTAGPKVEPKPLPATFVKPLVTTPGTTTNTNTGNNATTGNKGTGAPGPNRFNPNATTNTNTNTNTTNTNTTNTNTGNNTNKGTGAPGPNRFNPNATTNTNTNTTNTTTTNTNTGNNTNNKGTGTPGPKTLTPNVNTNANVNTNTTNTNTGNRGVTTGTGTSTNTGNNTNTGNKGAPGPNRFNPNATTTTNTNTNTTNTNPGNNGGKPGSQGNNQNPNGNKTTNATGNQNTNQNGKPKCDPKVQKCPPPG